MSQHTVGELARLSGLSVRTLHHYDAVGLLCPVARSEAGYRLYGRAELERLARILVWRELGLSLESIAEVLEQPGLEREALLEQRALIRGELEDRRRLLARIDDMLEERMSDPLFEEARQRWGQTEAFQESARRMKGYSPTQIEAMKAEARGITEGFAELKRAGIAADSEQGVAQAERFREHIERWFYPCSPRFHAQIAELYTGDARFEAHYAKVEPGLADFVRAAVRANAGLESSQG